MSVHALTPSQDQREAGWDQHDPGPPLGRGADRPEEPHHRYGVRAPFCVSARSLCADHLSSADVIHPAPGAEGRPSFTALVANVDSDTAKYVADCRVQTSRKELIEDLESMSQVSTPSVICGADAGSDAYWCSECSRCTWIIARRRRRSLIQCRLASSSTGVRRFLNVLRFSRLRYPADGVSEGQFKHVIEQGKFMSCSERNRLAHQVWSTKNSRSSKVSAILNMCIRMLNSNRRGMRQPQDQPQNHDDRGWEEAPRPVLPPRREGQER